MNRANPPQALESPSLGAFNGASPISQYSPIVKDTPNLGAVATFGGSPPSTKPASRDGGKPPPIITTDLSTGAGLGVMGSGVALSKDKSRSPSPRSPGENFLTEENMRIARLANSSRLGFNAPGPSSPGPNSTKRPVADFSKPLGYKKQHTGSNATARSAVASSGVGIDSGLNSPLMPINTAHSLPGQSPAATSTSNPSPKLPPPATLSQLIPSDSPRDERKPQWGTYFGDGKPESPSSSVYSGLPMGGHSRPLPANARGAPHNIQTRDADRESLISDLDAYEDIDAKSDVSSLNEFERFDFDSPRSSSVRGAPTNGR
jgi:hypothetical protein